MLSFTAASRLFVLFMVTGRVCSDSRLVFSMKSATSQLTREPLLDTKVHEPHLPEMTSRFSPFERVRVRLQ